MKCAAELETIRTNVVETRKLEMQTNALIKYQNASIRAVEYCENVLAKQFEEQALNGQSIYLHLNVEAKKDVLGNTLFRVCKTEPKYRTVHHRNGTTSSKRDGSYYYPQTDYLAYEVFAEYLAKYCYRSSIYCATRSSDNTYVGNISISANPKCDK